MFLRNKLTFNPRSVTLIIDFLGTHFEDLESSNIKHTDEELPLDLGVQCLVDTVDQPSKHTVVKRLGSGVDGVVTLSH